MNNRLKIWHLVKYSNISTLKQCAFGAFYLKSNSLKKHDNYFKIISLATSRRIGLPGNRDFLEGPCSRSHEFWSLVRLINR